MTCPRCGGGGGLIALLTAEGIPTGRFWCIDCRTDYLPCDHSKKAKPKCMEKRILDDVPVVDLSATGDATKFKWHVVFCPYCGESVGGYAVKATGDAHVHAHATRTRVRGVKR